MTDHQAPEAMTGAPPLPEPAHRGPDGTGSYFDSYTADQMRAYARTALSSQPSPEQAGVSDGWAIDDNGDGSINVKTPDGYACRLFKSGGGGVESVAYRLAILALRPAQQYESEARRAAQEQLYAERERHTAEVKRLQAEIGRLQSAQQAVPMTDAQIDHLKQGPSQSYRDFARAVEAHHGITAPAGGEKQA